MPRKRKKPPLMRAKGATHFTFWYKGRGAWFGLWVAPSALGLRAPTELLTAGLVVRGRGRTRRRAAPRRGRQVRVLGPPAERAIEVGPGLGGLAQLVTVHGQEEEVEGVALPLAGRE